MVAFEADTILKVPRLLAGLAVSTIGLALPAVGAVGAAMVQAAPSVMPAELFSVTAAFCAVSVRAPSWFVACDNRMSCVPAFNVNGGAACTHGVAWVISAFSAMLTPLGVPAMARGPSTLAELLKLMRWAVGLSVVTPVVVQAPPCVMSLSSVMLTTPPVTVRLPKVLDAFIRVIELPP